MILPMLAGMPWILLYLFLPFKIPGITSQGVPDASGDLTLSVFNLLLFMIPVYFNVYLLVRLATGGTKGYKKIEK